VASSHLAGFPNSEISQLDHQLQYTKRVIDLSVIHAALK